MGVPKFFRWLSERYPSLSTSINPDDVPEFDNLYLDMNGIIHPCSHPSDDPTFRITEEQIFDNVFRYIEFILQTIKPQKCFFMAVDGVAPRAKMNQQRARRFSSAKKSEEDEHKARQAGVVIPSKEHKFDSNTITPGTDFMDRLDKALRYYIQRRISEGDDCWTTPKIIYSGHQTPGEGEHKIADYVRYLRRDPSYDGSLRHCLYGLDADLIHLALASHEKNFCLLREEVKFGGKSRPGADDKKNSPIVKPEKVNFFLLSINVLRSYLELHEYKALTASSADGNWDKIRLIDDWIFLNFLVGNDFVPHAPYLHIKQQHIPDLIGYHIKTLRQTGKYLISQGVIDLPVFTVFLEFFANDFDNENHQKYEADAGWLSGKKMARRRQDAYNEAKSQGKSRAEAVNAVFKGGAQVALAATAATQPHSDDTDSADDMDISDLPEELRQRLAEQGTSTKVTKVEELDEIEEDAFTMWRQRYYWCKWKGFGVDSFDPMSDNDFVHADFQWPRVAGIAEDYIHTLQWICHYYFNGIQSWSWFYPHHYSPFLTDVVKRLKRDGCQRLLEFPDDEPFLPFQQLMGVLPPASRACLPIPYHAFMTQEDSPIIDFYPTTFSLDFNGKEQEWEAVVCIPFIDEHRLVNTIGTCDGVLTDYEKERNRHISATIFTKSQDRVEPSPLRSPNSKFCDVGVNYACVEHLADIHVHRIAIETINRATIHWEDREFTPGFPYLDYIEHTGHMTKAGVQVFDQASNNKSCVLLVSNPERSLSELALILLDPQIKFKTWVNWPHMYKAQITEVFDAESCHVGAFGETTAKETASVHPNYDTIIQGITGDKLYKRRGIDAGRYTVVARVKPRIGQKLMYITGKGFEIRDIFSEQAEYHLAEIIQIEGEHRFRVRRSNMEEAYLGCDTGASTTPSVDGIVPKQPPSQMRITDAASVQHTSYRKGSTVFVTNEKSEHYGRQGTIVEFNDRGKLDVEIVTPWYPNIKPLAEQASMDYRRSKLYADTEMVKIFKCTYSMLNNFNGFTCFLYGKSKVQLSFNCIHFKNQSYNRRYCVPSMVAGKKAFKFTKTFLDEVDAYFEKWPEVFTFMRNRGKTYGRGAGDVSDVNLKQATAGTERPWTDQRTQDFVAWLKQAPWTKSAENQKMSFSTRSLVLKDILSLEESIDTQLTENSAGNATQLVNLSFNDTFQWRSGMNKFQPNRKDIFRLYDRVLLVRSAIGRGIPEGRYGTIIAQHFTQFSNVLDSNPDVDSPTEVEVLFDVSAQNVSNYSDRVLRLHVSYLLKIESSVLHKAQKDKPRTPRSQGQEGYAKYSSSSHHSNGSTPRGSYHNGGQSYGKQRWAPAPKQSDARESMQRPKLLLRADRTQSEENRQLENELKNVLNIGKGAEQQGSGTVPPNMREIESTSKTQVQQQIYNNRQAGYLDGSRQPGRVQSAPQQQSAFQMLSQQMVRPQLNGIFTNPPPMPVATAASAATMQVHGRVPAPQQPSTSYSGAPVANGTDVGQGQIRQPLGPPSMPNSYPQNASFGFSRNMQAGMQVQQGQSAGMIGGINFNNVMLQQQMQQIIQQGVVPAEYTDPRQQVPMPAQPNIAMHSQQAYQHPNQIIQGAPRQFHQDVNNPHQPQHRGYHQSQQQRRNAPQYHNQNQRNNQQNMRFAPNFGNGRRGGRGRGRSATRGRGQYNAE